MKKLFPVLAAATLLVAGCSISGDTPATSTSATSSTTSTSTSTSSSSTTATSTSMATSTTEEPTAAAAAPATAQSEEPYVVQCLEGTPGPALWPDGTTAYSDWCWQQMGGAASASAEGAAGLTGSAPIGGSYAGYDTEVEMCAAHPEYPACNGGVDLPMTYTPTYNPNSGDGYGPSQQLPPLCVRFPSEYGPC